MLALLLFLILAWVVLGIIGFVVHGLFWLFVVACVLFLLTLVGGGFGRGRRSGRRIR
jgi:hypothetical protein